MDTRRIVVDGALLLGVLALCGVAWSQHRRLGELNEQVSKLEAEVEHARAAAPVVPTRSDDHDPSDGDEVDDRRTRERSPSIEARPRRRMRKLRPKDGDEPVEFERITIDVDDPKVRTKLRDVIQQEQEYLRDQRWARRQENREERTRERVREFAEQQELDETTTMQVEDRLVVEIAEITELFRKAREDGTWREAREKIGDVRDETDAELEALLEPEQFEAYRKMREEEFRGRRGRGDRDRGDRDRDRDRNADGRGER